MHSKQTNIIFKYLFPYFFLIIDVLYNILGNILGNKKYYYMVEELNHVIVSSNKCYKNLIFNSIA